MSIKKVAFDELLKEVDPATVSSVRAMAKKTAATGLVLFRNMDFNSSNFGCQSLVAIGPTCTYKVIEECEGKHLNDLPSQRQYPDMWCPVQSEVQDGKGV